VSVCVCVRVSECLCLCVLICICAHAHTLTHTRTDICLCVQVSALLFKKTLIEKILDVVDQEEKHKMIDIGDIGFLVPNLKSQCP